MIARAASIQYSHCSWNIVDVQQIAYTMLSWALLWSRESGTALGRWGFRWVEGTVPE